jgi:lipoprotein-anchoring transpeptidase ErfK/SrfK
MMQARDGVETGEGSLMSARRRDGEGHTAAGGRRGRTLLAAAALALALGGGCTATSSDPAAPASPSPSPPRSAAHITITPQNGARQAGPHRGVEVTVRDGTLVSVPARTGDDPLAGQFDVTRSRWRSRWALSTGTQYVVRATAIDADGRTVTRMSRFRTLVPHTTASIRIFQGQDVTYGVGMPVMLAFSRPVEDKKAVERAIVLTSSKKVVGAWYWNGDQALWFRPRSYWPQNVEVGFVGHFDGVRISPGVYATHTLRQRFSIGRSLVVVASASAHKMRVYMDRRLYATWPISTGRPGKETPNGTYLSIEKANPQHMVGPDYDIQVPYSVRFTWSGDFVHAAPWSVGAQGSANVSHGCVNLAPDRAKTYYEWSIPGDPVTVTGSPKAGKWDDGWTMWFLSWKELVKGSALHRAVRVGPDGSTWVRPSALKPSKAKAPLGRPEPDNAAAG